MVDQTAGPDSSPERQILLPLPVIELGFFDHPPLSLIAIPTQPRPFLVVIIKPVSGCLVWKEKRQNKTVRVLLLYGTGRDVSDGVFGNRKRQRNKPIKIEVNVPSSYKSESYSRIREEVAGIVGY